MAWKIAAPSLILKAGNNNNFPLGYFHLSILSRKQGAYIILPFIFFKLALVILISAVLILFT